MNNKKRERLYSEKRKIRKEKNNKRFNTSKEFIGYLKNRLIPDLIESGRDATADDFKEAILWIEHYQHCLKNQFS